MKAIWGKIRNNPVVLGTLEGVAILIELIVMIVE